MRIVHPRCRTERPAPEYRPAFVRDAQVLVSQTGNLATGTQRLLRRARLPVDVVGDTVPWRRRGTGTLLVGCHRDLIEFIPLLSTLAALGRTDAHFIARNSSWGARVARTVEPLGAGTILPVVPRGDRRNTFFDAAPSVRRPSHPTNSATLRHAAELLQAGRTVVIFPATGGVDAARTYWRPGLGRIINHLSPDAREIIRIVLFRFDDIRATKVFRSLILSSHGVVPRRPYPVTLRIGAQGTVPELLGPAAVAGHLQPPELSERLRGLFIESFIDFLSTTHP